MKRYSKREICVLIMNWNVTMLMFWSSFIIFSLYSVCIQKSNNIIFNIISITSTWHIYHTCSYLPVTWKELLPETNCELSEACQWLVIKCLTESQILDISIVREIMQMKKCKKHRPSTRCELFSTLAVTFMWRRLWRSLSVNVSNTVSFFIKNIDF